ncbi:MAG TPA: ABC transporter ATP-binding protein [Kiloniellales bacterium]|jgi:branched-chain amino acid transport system ATP-binding protein
MAAVTLLSTESLSKHFGGLTAVDGVSFTFLQGEVRALIGPNGAGKTTFVNLLSGRIPPSSGRVIFAGEDITRLPAHTRVNRGIAYTFQITSTFTGMSALENVKLACQHQLSKGFFGPDLDVLERASLSALERVGLADRRDEIAGNLSYGHQRLLEVAMGLGLAPKLLILDEPTQGLADEEIAVFVALVREIALNASVLLIEHNMDVVMGVADTITVLDRGRILAEGTPEEIRQNEAVRRAYLGN